MAISNIADVVLDGLGKLTAVVQPHKLLPYAYVYGAGICTQILYEQLIAHKYESAAELGAMTLIQVLLAYRYSDTT